MENSDPTHLSQILVKSVKKEKKARYELLKQCAGGYFGMSSFTVCILTDKILVTLVTAAPDHQAQD